MASTTVNVASELFWASLIIQQSRAELKRGVEVERITATRRFRPLTNSLNNARVITEI